MLNHILRALARIAGTVAGPVLLSIGLGLPAGPAYAGDGPYACEAQPSAYFDGMGGVFDDYYDETGFPVFNADHCYDHFIYSTDGTDTYTDPGPGRTTTGGCCGYQCFELAQRYFWFRYGVSLARYPSASSLCNQQLPEGARRIRPGEETPLPGDLFVFNNSQCGMSDTDGHVAVVTKVWNNEAVQVAQQNMSAERFSVMNVRTSCACAFIRAQLNTNVNGPFVATPSPILGPEGSGGSTFVPVRAGPTDPNACRCRSTDPLSMWPLCCKRH